MGHKYETIEGCKTWVGKDIIAERHQAIVVEYENIAGEKIKRHILGFEAQIFQHEINHLNGIEEVVVEEGSGIRSCAGYSDSEAVSTT